MLRISISDNYYPCLKESFTPHFAVEEVLPWRVGPANSRCTKEEEETSSTLLNGNSFSNFGCIEHPVRNLTCFGCCFKLLRWHQNFEHYHGLHLYKSQQTTPTPSNHRQATQRPEWYHRARARAHHGAGSSSAAWPNGTAGSGCFFWAVKPSKATGIVTNYRCG